MSLNFPCGFATSVVAFLAIQSSPFAAAAAEAPPRIVGGLAAVVNDFPYQVSFRFLNSHICGGSIISPTHILTAAHCIRAPEMMSEYSIQAGITTRADPTAGQVRTVSDLVIHPRYNIQTGSNVNDIAILILSTPLTFGPLVNKIELPPKFGLPVFPGTELEASGWGTASQNSGSPTMELRKVTVPVVSRTDCIKAYSETQIAYSMICAGEAGKDSCEGDSGGPLATLNLFGLPRLLIGVTSFGIGCGRPQYPGVYTRVTSFRSWIWSTVGV